jgi:tetratricopeptide (TPR) repeat protein
MPKQLVHSAIPILLLTLLFSTLPLVAQSPKSGASSPAGAAPPVTAEKAIELAQQGRCKEAMPSLKRAVSSPGNATDLRKSAGVSGLRCALSLDDRDAVVSFIQLLHKQFPRDPDVLFVTVHAYSDLSTRTAQDLGLLAPQSIPAHKLNAEALEMQGRWDEAKHEYEEMIKKEPNLPGTHFLLGRLFLSRPEADPNAAKQEFQKEVEIDPKNAGAYYVLGELARRGDKCDEALPEFSQAAKLDPNFAEAYFGWGSCLVTLKKYEEAIGPLRTAVQLTPRNGSAHYALATALSFSGHKEEADQEFAIHRSLTAAMAPAPPSENPQ